MIIQNTAGGEQKKKKSKWYKKLQKDKGGCASLTRWTKEKKSKKKS